MSSKWLVSLLVAVAVVAATSIGVNIRLLTKPKPRPDYTALKRDLMELNQILDHGLDERTAIASPEQFVAAIEQLERDFRLQKPPVDKTSADLIEKVLNQTSVVRSHASDYLYYRAWLTGDYHRRPEHRGARDDVAESGRRESWAQLKLAYAALMLPGANQIERAIKKLEADESGDVQASARR